MANFIAQNTLLCILKTITQMYKRCRYYASYSNSVIIHNNHLVSWCHPSVRMNTTYCTSPSVDLTFTIEYFISRNDVEENLHRAYICLYRTLRLINVNFRSGRNSWSILAHGKENRFRNLHLILKHSF